VDVIVLDGLLLLLSSHHLVPSPGSLWTCGSAR